jgi:hypothetical protein
VIASRRRGCNFDASTIFAIGIVSHDGSRRSWRCPAPAFPMTRMLFGIDARRIREAHPQLDRTRADGTGATSRNV